jgi:phosphoheptose isomerase
VIGSTPSSDRSPSRQGHDSLRIIKHVIVDRDGVLNEEMDGGACVADPQGFHWLPGVLDALANLHALGIRVSVATNQSGVGRGSLSEQDLKAVHQKMTSDATAAQASIDAIFYCPHAPAAACACRKPAPGLINAAITESGISAAHTLVVGDAARDLDAARSAGAHAALVRTGKGRLHESYAAAQGIPVYDDLRTLVAGLGCGNGNAHNTVESLQAIFAEHLLAVADAATQLLPALAQCIEAARHCLDAGGKILACGNGGSAADAQHFVAELVGRYMKSRSALSAVVLGSDSATLTAVSNDFGFEHVFARQVDALARPGDVLVALSTSGNSPNVIRAAVSARKRGCLVIALTGRSGGTLVEQADIALRVPSETVARIQEVHELCLHALAQALEERAT